MADPTIKVSKFTLKRLPYYYRFICDCLDQERKFISSEEIARAVQINAVQIRRDLMVFNAIGIPGVGYSTPELKLKLEEVLGLKNINEAVLIGVGRLGRAIVDYPGFERYGLNIVALFDADPDVIGEKINDREVFPVQELPHIMKRLHIKVGSEGYLEFCSGVALRSGWRRGSQRGFGRRVGHPVSLFGRTGRT